LQSEGLSTDDIAARFGLSELVVRQRLKLSAVSPRLMAEYRNAALTLEQLMCFTITDDHGLQETVWFDNPFVDQSPSSLRRQLTRSQVEGTDRRARFVGAEAYEKAGGIVIRDLFQPESDGYFSDSQLLDRLAAEKLKAEAEVAKAEGWSWVDVSLEADFGQWTRFRRVPPADVMLSKRDERRLTRLSERYDALAAAMDEEEDAKLTAEFEQISAELDALQARKQVWTDEAKQTAGAIVSLSGDGTLRIVRGLIKGPIEATDMEEGVRETGQSTEQTASVYSNALLVDLSAHRTAALRAVLAGKPDKALTALLDKLVACIFFDGDSLPCLALAPTLADLGKASASVGESKASAALHAQHMRWVERLPDQAALWAWLEALAESERLELLAYCVALCVDAVHPAVGRTSRLAAAERLASTLSLDMADWWRPTAASFFGKVTKEIIVAAVSEGASPAAAHRLRGLKKSQMGQEAEMLLGPGRWLPEPLRPRPLENSETQTDVHMA
jgi:ParB family chromosome partitioning protein